MQLNPPGGTTCVYNPISLALTTSGGSPIAGHTFTVTNGTNVSIATGILQTTWTNSTFPNGTGGDCTLIDSIVHGGNGQLALGNGFDLTPEIAPPPSGGGTVTSAPKKKKCKKGQKKVKVHGKIKCKKKK